MVGFPSGLDNSDRDFVAIILKVMADVDNPKSSKISSLKPRLVIPISQDFDCSVGTTSNKEICERHIYLVITDNAVKLQSGQVKLFTPVYNDIHHTVNIRLVLLVYGSRPTPCTRKVYHKGGQKLSFEVQVVTLLKR